MFRAESMWGQLARFLTNMRYIEATIFHAWKDKEVITFLRQWGMWPDGGGEKEVVEFVHACMRAPPAADGEGQQGGEGDAAQQPSAAGGECQQGGEAQRQPPAQAQAPWGKEELLLSSELVTKLDFPIQPALRQLSPHEVAHLHNCYVREVPSYGCLFQAFVRERLSLLSDDELAEHGMSVGMDEEGARSIQFSDASLMWVRPRWEEWARAKEGLEGESGHAEMWNPYVRSFCIVAVGPIKLSKGDWFLARPNEEDVVLLRDGDDEANAPAAGLLLPKFGVPARLWFGKVKSIVQHIHLDGSRRGLSIAEEEGGPFDVELQAPIVSSREFVNVDGLKEVAFFPAASVLPLSMTALPHPTRAGCLVMLRPSWHCLVSIKCPVPWPELEFEGRP